MNPHDFVRVLKWHHMPGTLGELRDSFDSAAKRRAVASEVAIRRSKMAEENREHALSAEDEVRWQAGRVQRSSCVGRRKRHTELTRGWMMHGQVATEEQRALMERRMAEEGLRLKRQRKLKEMSGPPRLLVDWAVPQDLHDLQVRQLSCLVIVKLRVADA